jgi:hypothetical protein
MKKTGNKCSLCRPFRAGVSLWCHTQGVALGFIIMPISGRKKWKPRSAWLNAKKARTFGRAAHNSLSNFYLRFLQPKNNMANALTPATYTVNGVGSFLLLGARSNILTRSKYNSVLRSAEKHIPQQTRRPPMMGGLCWQIRFR